MIPPTPSISTINTTLDEDQASFCEELENQSYQTPETKIPMCELENSTNTMAPKKTNTRSATNKMKEFETTTTSLVQRMDNVHKENFIETSWDRLWKEIKKWSYKD